MYDILNIQDQDVAHSGDLYCAPGCGRGCTRAEFDEAVRVASDLHKELTSDWDIEVFDNLGWHVAATNGCARISYKNKSQIPFEKYVCIINVPRMGSVVAHGETATEAAKNAAKGFKININEMMASFSRAGIDNLVEWSME